MNELLEDLQRRRLLVGLIPETVKEQIVEEYKKTQLQIDLDRKKAQIITLQSQVASLEAKKAIEEEKPIG